MRDIYVYGSIGRGSWDEEGFTARQLVEELGGAGGEDVCIHVNSGGGDVFEAQAMSEAIRGYRGRVTACIEGLAASSASFFALTADEVAMNPTALVMVHNPYTFAVGDASELRATAGMLDKVRQTIARAYASKTGRGLAEVGGWMDAETWMDADEALALGLVDSLTDAAPVAACVSRRVLDGYRNAPEALTAAGEPAAGEPGGSMAADGNAGETSAGAAAGGAGSAPRAVCVNGVFLNAKE